MKNDPHPTTKKKLRRVKQDKNYYYYENEIKNETKKELNKWKMILL